MSKADRKNKQDALAVLMGRVPEGLGLTVRFLHVRRVVLHDRSSHGGDPDITLTTTLSELGAYYSDNGIDPNVLVAEILPTGGETVCEIVSGDMVVASGDALCSPHDNYDKLRGSLLSLSRAIKNAEHYRWSREFAAAQARLNAERQGV